MINKSSILLMGTVVDACLHIWLSMVVNYVVGYDPGNVTVCVWCMFENLSKISGKLNLLL